MHPSADDLFNDALELRGEERLAFLAAACAGNRELRAEIDSLLVAYEGAPDTLIGANVPAVPERIGAYPIREEIGRGSMGVVYLASDEKLQRQIAVKLLPDLLARQPDWLERFRREARLLAALNHPNIATIYSLEEDSGLHFLTMELVEGETLARRIGGEPLPREAALAICLQIAKALEAAHERGVIHRDLKPLNIIVTPDGTVKVLDFGLAKIVGESLPGGALPGGPGDSIAAGTPGYMSPEQLRGAGVDMRSDMWAFGCIVHECFTGTPLFDAATLAELESSLEDAGNLPALREAAPARIHELARRLLAVDPDERLADAGEARRLFATEMAAGRAGGRPAARRRLAFRLAAAALLLGAAWFAPRLLREQTSPAPPMASHEQLTFSGTAILADISPDGLRIAYVEALMGTQNEVWIEEIGGAGKRKVFEASDVLSLRWSPDGENLLIAGEERGSNWRGTHLVSAQGGGVRRYEVFGPLAWAPDGRHFACVPQLESRGLVVITELLTDARIDLLPGGGISDLADVAWSPDGLRLALLSVGPKERVLWAVAVSGGQVNRIVSRESLSSPRWSARSDAIYFLDTAAQSLMRVAVSPSSGERAGEPELVLSGLYTTEFSLTPDGNRFVHARGPGRSNLWLRDLSAGGEAEALTAGTFDHGRARFSPDGNEIAFSRISGERRTLMVMPTAGGEPRRVSSSDHCQYPVWSPDGERIALSVVVDGVTRVATVAASGGDLRFRDEVGAADALDWRPGGRILFRQATSRRFAVLDPETGAIGAAGDSDRIQWQARWAPDGERYAVLETNAEEPGDPRVAVYSLGAGTRRDIYTGVGTPIGWSPDGAEVYLATPETQAGALGESADVKRRIAILRVPARGGEPALVAVLPPLHLWSSIDLSPDASKLVYSRQDFSSDIWMIENFDRARR